MGIRTDCDEIEMLEEAAPVMVAALFDLEAKLGAGDAANALRAAAESLMSALDALAVIHWPDQDQGPAVEALLH